MSGGGEGGGDSGEGSARGESGAGGRRLGMHRRSVKLLFRKVGVEGAGGMWR